MEKQKVSVNKNILKALQTAKLFIFLCFLIFVACLIMIPFTNFDADTLLFIAFCTIIIGIIGSVLMDIDLKAIFLKEFCLVYNFSANAFQQESSWDFIEELEKFNIYNSIGALKKKFLFLGKVYSRNFSLYEIQNAHNDEIFFLIRTDIVKKVKNTILIAPKELFGNKYKDLQKAEIDTQGMFEIFTDNPKEISTDLSKEFLDALKNSAKNLCFLITPQGVLLTQIKNVYTAFSLLYLFPQWAKFKFMYEGALSFSFSLFSSSKKQVQAKWQQVEDSLKLLNLINLLEKK